MNGATTLREAPTSAASGVYHLCQQSNGEERNRELTSAIAIFPRGFPFQATVSPVGKLITASNGPALVMDPTRPVVKAKEKSEKKQESIEA